MNIVTRTFLLFFILLGISICANIDAETTAEPASESCSFWKAFTGVSCFFKYVNFVINLRNLDMSDKDDLENFKGSCNSSRECFESLLSCNSNMSMFFINSTLEVCEAVLYIAEDFVNCTDKLESTNSTCFKEWLPRQAKKKVMKNNEKDFFGKDGCVESETKETCGTEEWTKFEKYYTEIRKYKMKKYLNVDDGRNFFIRKFSGSLFD